MASLSDGNSFVVASSSCITGSYFFNDLDEYTLTVNVERYTNIINNFFAPRINDLIERTCVSIKTRLQHTPSV